MTTGRRRVCCPSVTGRAWWADAKNFSQYPESWAKRSSISSSVNPYRCTAEIADGAFDKQWFVMQLLAQVVKEPLNQTLDVRTWGWGFVVRAPALCFLERQPQIERQGATGDPSPDGLTLPLASQTTTHALEPFLEQFLGVRGAHRPQFQKPG